MHNTCYARDFVLWVESQSELLREKQFQRLDLDNLIEELMGMASNRRHELQSRLEVLIMHLLKCEFQPQMRTPSWLSTIHTQRFAIELCLEESPSLHKLVDDYAQRRYASAVRHAMIETGLPKTAFPATNPYTPKQLLDPDFIPLP